MHLKHHCFWVSTGTEGGEEPARVPTAQEARPGTMHCSQGGGGGGQAGSTGGPPSQGPASPWAVHGTQTAD